jgi:hypothetical protein
MIFRGSGFYFSHLLYPAKTVEARRASSVLEFCSANCRAPHYPNFFCFDDPERSRSALYQAERCSEHMGIRIALSVLFLGPAASEVSFSEDAAHPSVLHLREFAENPSVTAHARQTVLLDTQLEDVAEPAIRYELGAGKHHFCLKKNDPYFTGLALEDATGEAVFMPSYVLCTAANPPEGIYTLRVNHSRELQPNPKRLARVQVEGFPPG